MSIRIHTHTGDIVDLTAQSDETLARAIFTSGLWRGVALCSGLGKCGLCRVRFISEAPPANRDEHKKLGPEALEQGWRLACLHPAESCELEIPEPTRSNRAVQTHLNHAGEYTLAVDLGTTSIHWAALIQENVVASGQELNPQTGLGSEVMTRLATAATESGRKLLKELVLDRIEEIIRDINESLHGRCVKLAISGNSAMTYILLGLQPDDLATAPYTLSYTGGDEEHIAASLPPAYIPPLLAPFVGADISAGLVATEYAQTPHYPFLLADLGTNGEFILALSPEKRICASVPMGPALEGVGLSFGRTAGPGAITGFQLTPGGLVPTYFDAKTTGPAGMTGTGYLSLTAILLRHGVLDESGRFGQGNTPLAAKLASKVTTVANEPTFQITSDLFLPASDVEEILKVKAAFNLAMSTLLDTANIGPSQLAAILIAGALGEHVSLKDLETLGFLPPGGNAKTVKAGNTSLQGTQHILTNTGARNFARTLPDTITALDLATDESFSAKYLERMRFTYVD